ESKATGSAGASRASWWARAGSGPCATGPRTAPRCAAGAAGTDTGPSVRRRRPQTHREPPAPPALRTPLQEPSTSENLQHQLVEGHLGRRSEVGDGARRAERLDLGEILFVLGRECVEHFLRNDDRPGLAGLAINDLEVALHLGPGLVHVED